MGIHRPAQQPAGSLPRHTPSPSRAAKSQVLHRHSHGCSPACPAACRQVAGPLPPHTHIPHTPPRIPNNHAPLPRNQPTSSSQPLSPVLMLTTQRSLHPVLSCCLRTAHGTRFCLLHTPSPTSLVPPERKTNLMSFSLHRYTYWLETSAENLYFQ